MDKKNTMLLTVIAVATLLVAVVGATFAYFTANNTVSGTTNVTTSTETLGAVVVSNPTSAMYLKLNAAQMAPDAKNNSYYATVTETNNYSSTKEDAVISKMTVSGGETTTKYTTTFKLNVSKSATVEANDATVVFTLADGVTMTSGDTTVTSGSDIDYASLKDTYTVSYVQTGNTTGVELIKVAIKLNNLNAEQDHLAGQSLTTSFTNADLTVAVSNS